MDPYGSCLGLRDEIKALWPLAKCYEVHITGVIYLDAPGQSWVYVRSTISIEPLLLACYIMTEQNGVVGICTSAEPSQAQK